jgi:hypothetical protein
LFNSLPAFVPQEAGLRRRCKITGFRPAFFAKHYLTIIGQECSVIQPLKRWRGTVLNPLVKGIRHWYIYEASFGGDLVSFGIADE